MEHEFIFLNRSIFPIDGTLIYFVNLGQIEPVNNGNGEMQYIS